MHQYRVGMYGGSFDPLHIGHMNIIIKAACVCKQLYVVLSYSRTRDTIPMEFRYRWIMNSFKHMSNVHIILLEDTAKSKAEYDTNEYWEQGRDEVIRQIGSNVDVLFCGSDYKGSNRYEHLYSCPVVYFNRDEIDISSTQIRSNPLKYWEYIPQICRSYYVKKVLLIGGESTGKSTLAQNLAMAYNTNYLEEVGRDVCDFAGSEELMIAEDFQEILLKHKQKELELIKGSNRFLFVDTDALTTKFYSCFLLVNPEDKMKNDLLADALTQINKFDLIFFLEPTVDFVQDGTRNETIKADREKYSNQIKELFDDFGFQYHCVSGDYLERFTYVKGIIDEKYSF